MARLVPLFLCAALAGCDRPATPPERPKLPDVAREFGFGPSQDPTEDERLRKEVLGKWVRTDSDQITLEFREGGAFAATGWLDGRPPAAGEDPARAPFEGKWAINDGRLKVSGPHAIVVYRIRMPDDNTIQLFDSPERIDKAYVYHRR